MPNPAPSYNTSTYTVEPHFQIKKGKVVSTEFRYFTEHGVYITSPTAEHMRAEYQNGNGDFVGFTLRQARFTDEHGEHQHMVQHQCKEPYEVRMYAAVAKTLGDSKQIPNFIPSADQVSVMIPVYKGTSRGVILIFQLFVDGMFTQLVASPDPEIGNSTNGPAPTPES